MGRAHELNIFNTLTGRKEPFKPLKRGQVRMYVCGVTVYDDSHLGHARSAVVFDVIRRYLEYRGLKVKFVKNFTDVDDKIINRANQLGIPWQKVTTTYIKAYYRDMKRLGVRKATEEPKATEHMKDIIKLINKLLKKGHAYQLDGDVYYEVKSYPAYGRLSKRNTKDLLAGARVEVDERKRNPMDFALWKSSKPGEPAWPWLGREEQLRVILPYLLTKLQEQGLPKVAATPVMGLHHVNGTYYFVGDRQVLAATTHWEGYNGPIAWLPSKREHPEMCLSTECTKEDLDTMAELLPQLNDPEAIWPMIGWYAAAPLKPWLEQHSYRFPILSVVGTKGAGKTTLIQRVFMPLFGQTDPRSYDAGTTRFVTLALMGSSNAVPVAFSEFRYDSVERFLRFILLAYDTGHDPRGRSDQTTTDYALSAPFSVDGEDLIEDPAARERIVVVQLHPAAVDEGSTAYAALYDLRAKFPKNFGGYYVQRLLGWLADGTLETLLVDARESVFKEFPSKLPDRVRLNHIVAYFGILLWCKTVGSTPPEASVLRRAIATVFDLVSGRGRTLADSMVEDVANACSQGTNSIKFKVVDDGRILYFQLSSAHSWWLTSRRRQGRGALERDAIRAQLKEAPYFKDTLAIEDSWMYGIDLQKAQDAGLDVPARVNMREITVRF